MWAVLTNRSYSKELSSSTINVSVLTNSTARNSQLQPGDYLLIWHQNRGQKLYLDHIALLLDDDLYFEKAGSGDNTPFRVATWEQLIADWVPFVFHFEWRRPIASFPNVEDALGLRNPQITAEFPVLLQLKRSVANQFCLAPELEGSRVDGNTYLWIKQLDDFVELELGRVRLNGTAFKPETLLIDVPKEIYQ